MTSLIDIAPATETVAGVTVHGVDARGISILLRQFPELRMLLTGVEVTPARLADLGPDIVANIIAAATGHPGEEKHVEAAGRLNLEQTLDFLGAAIRLTIPSGIGPFMAKLEALTSVAGVELGKVAAGTSPQA